MHLLHDSICPIKGAPRADVDFVIFRENTEGPYAGVGGNLTIGIEDEVAMQQDVSTRKAVERIIRYAFEFAVKTGRRSVCMADKHNVQPAVGGLWLRVFHEVAREYPAIDSFHLFADALALQMVREPRRFAVIVTNSLFGVLITDLGAALEGGGDGGVGESASPKDFDVRANPRQRASVRRERHRQSDGDDSHRRDDARRARTPGRGAAEVEEAVTRAVVAGEGTPDIGGKLGTRATGDAFLPRLPPNAATSPTTQSPQPPPTTAT